MITISLVLKIVLILALVIALALIINHIEDRKKSFMSFRESLDLAELPIVTFYQGDKKLNFLLDTGANISTIEQKVVNTIKATFNEKISSTVGIGGRTNPLMNVDIAFTYKGKDFTDTFQVADMSPVFGAIKESTGVTVHGLIGNSFMQKYKYILDFDEMVAYSKK